MRNAEDGKFRETKLGTVGWLKAILQKKGGINVFSEELKLIKNDEIRETTARLLDGAPDYFWHVAASSSGKYHPAYALGEGGLVRHVKAAVRFANHLFVINDFTDKEQDYIISALLLHDILKHGKDGDEGHTVFEHPILAADYIRENTAGEYSEVVASLVSTHMGQWTTSKYSSAMLQAPETKLQKFVHECDYLASRKDIEVLF
nr:MAG TPA: HDc [Caudoviricetes sp.]